jgi:hypothetical protein
MQPGLQKSRGLLPWVLLPLIGLLAWFINARAGWPPKIDFIEPFHRTNILIHFDTEANYAYELQFTELINTNGQPGPHWTNLYVADNLPFFNHYVVLDTNVPLIKKRFYRLRAFR